MRFNWQNLHLPTADDLNNQQLFGDLGTRQRMTDLASWGILRDNAWPAEATAIPVSSGQDMPNLNPSILEFPIYFDTELGRLSVGSGANSGSTPPVAGGVAYDGNGKRIVIADDTSFTFSNDIPEGKQSSGNINIPLSLTGTVGGCDTNEAELGTYYLWAEYLEINDPLVNKVTRAGAVTYPHIEDGYKLRLTVEPTAPSGDGVSIFLAKIVWAISYPGFLQVLPTQQEEEDGAGNSISAIPDDVAGEPNRVYAAFRQQNIEVLPTAAAKPTEYAFGMRMHLGDHISAVGSAAPTPSNPHGLTLADIPGAGSEPLATENQKTAFAKGIVDLNIDQNSPNTPSDCLGLTIDQQTLTPADIDATSTAGTGIPQSAVAQDAWVRVGSISTNEAVFVDGKRLTVLYPSLVNTQQFSADPAPTDGWISFASGDTAGTYALLATAGVVNGVDVLLLRKLLVEGGEGFSADIPNINDITPTDSLGDRLLLGYVYWDSSSLYRDYLQAQSALATTTENFAVDQRSLGVVGPQQLSTELKSDPTTGGLSKQRVENMVGNSNFATDKDPTQFPGWTIVDSAGAGFIVNADIERFDTGDDPTVATNAGMATPAVLSGITVTPTPGATNGTTKMYATLGNLKPSTKYSLSFWYKTLSTQQWNSRVRVGINSTTSTEASVITTGGGSGKPVDVMLINDGTWHRANVVVETIGTVTPANTYYLEVRFDAPSTAYPSGAADALRLTAFQATEGEWLVGYSANSSSGQGSYYAFDEANPLNGAADNLTTILDKDFYTTGGLVDIFASIDGEHNIVGGGCDTSLITTLLINTVEVERVAVRHSIAGVIGNAFVPIPGSMRYLAALPAGVHNVRIIVNVASNSTGGSSATTVHAAKVRIKLG